MLNPIKWCSCGVKYLTLVNPGVVKYWLALKGVQSKHWWQKKSLLSTVNSLLSSSVIWLVRSRFAPTEDWRQYYWNLLQVKTKFSVEISSQVPNKLKKCSSCSKVHCRTSWRSQVDDRNKVTRKSEIQDKKNVTCHNPYVRCFFLTLLSRDHSLNVNKHLEATKLFA